MERLNGEIRDREKVFRELKKDDSPAIEGVKLYHNYIRPHGPELRYAGRQGRHRH